MDRPDLMSLKEIARTLAMSEWFVRKLIRDGRLPKGKRVGDRMIRWFRRDVDKYLVWLEMMGEDVDLDENESAEADETPEKSPLVKGS